MAAAPPRARGLLLVNLGTPDAPTTPAVRRYLREFLSDPRVVDIPAPLRWMLLNLIILPTRPARSAEAYRKIWGPDGSGSPLLHHSRRLEQAVAAAVGDEFVVKLAMRYGNPSLREALESFRRARVGSVTLLPLYPQYAASSTGSTVARAYELASAGWDPLHLTVVPPFFHAGGFLDAFAEVARPVLAEARPDHVLFSFHGLPERQVRRSAGESGAPCRFEGLECRSFTAENATCYRAQSFHTARELAVRLGLTREQFSVGFQSRLGRTPWIRPHTDVLLAELPKRGVKNLAVMVPSFVADCLETLEEIGIRGVEAFKAAGGERLTLVPSLNAHPAWVAEVVRLARAAAG